MSEPLYTLLRGDSPLLISVPHAGTYIPAALRSRMSVAAQEVADTDWHVPLLYEFALAMGAGLLVATHSRYVLDLNRNADGTALYVGADNTELCPTRSFANDDLYLPGQRPDAAEIARRCEQYWQPFHCQLAAELQVIKARHGYALLLDGHSIRAEVPRFFDGKLPDLNLGTADGSSCASGLQAQAEAVLLSAKGFTAISNGRFKGGTITRRYGKTAQGVHALQLEIAQSCYMQEGAPYAWNPRLAAPLIAVLRQLVKALLSWHE